MNLEFLVWVCLLLLAPIGGIWGIVSAKRRARREAEGAGREGADPNGGGRGDA